MLLNKGVFIHKLLNHPQISCSLINLDFLVSYTAHKSIVLPFFVRTTFGVLLSLLFLHFNQYDNIVL